MCSISFGPDIFTSFKGQHKVTNYTVSLKPNSVQNKYCGKNIVKIVDEVESVGIFYSTVNQYFIPHRTP